MKRKAILIGNTHGLNGVKTDLEHTGTFLRSSVGGGWYSNEIEVFENPSKDQLLRKLEIVRKESNDYVFVLFSGHGGQERNTILELNGNGETISESQLQDIGPRQLSIFDCCRAVVEQVRKSIALESLSASFSESASVRRKYEERIMEAIHQQARLYSCAVGEKSYDTPQGAMYLGNLLAAARAIDPFSAFKTVESAHAEARLTTIRDSREKQSPEAVLPKCLTRQQLVIAMRS